MKKLAVLMSLLIFISFLLAPVGCKKARPSPTPQFTPAPTIAAPVITSAPSPTPGKATAAPTPSPASPAPSPAIAPPRPPVEAAFSLTIDSPASESIVKDKTILVRGKASPDAVVTIGNSNVDVDENGGFTASITLVEGVNIIEVLASNLTGSTRGQVLTIIYAP